MTATWRRHWKIPVGMAVLVASLLLVGGGIRVIAYVGSGGSDPVTHAGDADYDSGIGLFDDSVVHSIALDFDQSDLDAAITIYRQTGEKEYFLANITIDGVTIEDIGVRIKGNSTLHSALQGDADPDDIPFLVKLDEYNSGVTYQGFSELALRTEGPRGDELILEEMVTAEVLEVAGLPFPETSYTGLSINGGPETLRVIVEQLDDGYVERLFDGDGVLYKAQSGDSFTYLGHDPTAYEGAFTQETAGNEADLEPLLDFLEFVDTATDEEFEAELNDWLDVDSFIDYVAINNLLVSVDSMPGNGNNYYLWYDAGDDRFTVLAWDLNESFGGFWMASTEPNTELLPDWSNLTESGSFGGNGFPGGGPPAGGPGGAGGGTGPEGGDARPAGGSDVTFDYTNPLVDRFLATDSFLEAYEDRYAELYETLFRNDVLVDLIDEYSALLATGNLNRLLVTDAELESGATGKRQWVADRMTFLAGAMEG